ASSSPFTKTCLAGQLTAAGLQLFRQALETGLTRRQAASMILSSAEFQQHLLAALYGHYLARPVDPVGAATFLTALQAGLRTDDLVADLVGSSEYLART